MNYDKIIEAIERDIRLPNHFTDYDFGEILNIKCPRPERSIFLRDEYFGLMNNLKDFLIAKPTKDLINIFILESVRTLDSSKYLIQEFELLILKYNGFNHFLLGIGTAKEYLDRQRGELNYELGIKKN